MPNQHRVGDLHHRGLQMHREQHALGLGVLDLRIDEAGQRLAAEHRGIDHLAFLHRHLVLEHRAASIGADEGDLQRAGRAQRGRTLATVEVAGLHVRHMGLRIGRPLAHAVRVLAGVVLHRQRRAAVGVALAQHRVDRAALDPVIARLGILLRVGLGLVGVGRQRIALVLQLLDRGLELRHRGGDVGQLDDVGFGRGGQRAQFGQVVGDLLRIAQQVGELRQDAPGQRDVAGLDHDAGGVGIGVDDGQERLRGQERGFVGQRVQDLGRAGHCGRCLSCSDGAAGAGATARVTPPVAKAARASRRGQRLAATKRAIVAPRAGRGKAPQPACGDRSVPAAGTSALP
ncbi:hypothetical protein QE438_002980 [Pseudoxanthomonas sp. SORGH_AS 997]|nr:hypothetical protein [Pseudoxanthomonas sp. SORGH_AS_0997]